MIPKRDMDLLFEWRNWFGKHRSLFVSKIAPMLIVDNMKGRNNCTFNGVEVSVIKLESL